jgi:TonB-linked SusC/RagA family outer membrane protein
MNKLLLPFFYFILVAAPAALAQVTRSGRVVSATDGLPLAGVNVIIQGSTRGTTTAADGSFSLLVAAKEVLVFSFIGYRTHTVVMENDAYVEVSLEEDVTTLSEVSFVSTGYEQLPKERVTGSFEQIDQALLTRRISTDLLSRIEDITPGLVFHRNVEGRSELGIRGRSTLFGNAKPLIILDYFPYDGDLQSINPNDVASVTVLKDAAAASIWGARAGNGVIVITTKRGEKNQAPIVTFRSSVTRLARPDVYYAPRMRTADFVDLEQTLFAQGRYALKEIAANKTPLTPAVEAMIAHRDGLMSDAALEATLAEFRQHDVRDDYHEYLYQPAVQQQYALRLQGGGEHHRYTLGVGYDHNTESLVRNGQDRLTLQAHHAWDVWKNKLTVEGGMFYEEHEQLRHNPGPTVFTMGGIGALYPYARLKDDLQQPAAVVHDYRLPFLHTAEAQGSLPWHFKPLEELALASHTTKANEYRFQTALRYQVIPHLHADVLYQFWQARTDTRNHRSADTYFARNLINLYSQVSAGTRSYPIPLGGMLDLYGKQSTSEDIRLQLRYARTWPHHEVSALGGYEVRDFTTEEQNNRFYGYDDAIASSASVNYRNSFALSTNPATFGTIPFVDYLRSSTDRFISYFTNAAYTYRHKYTVSASGRKDQSNLFGVRTNQRGVPLWSVGSSWRLSDESFYAVGWLPRLTLRMTLGYNGNIDKSLTAYTTAFRLGSYWLTGLPYATITNPPNDQLRWERVRIWNTGVDFSSKEGLVRGSVEFYHKHGMDLIGLTPYPPSTGILEFKGNYAATRGYGWDVHLDFLPVNKRLVLQSTLLVSTNREKVTDYAITSGGVRYLNSGSGAALENYPLKGKPLYAIYSLPFAGLDPQTGDPRGYVEGQPSTDYQTILNQATASSIKYHGPARPTVFGALRHTLTYNNFSISMNLSYRLGYYFRRSSVLYNTLLEGYVGHGDYANRWQQPGDETHTHVPSLPTQLNANRDTFYQYSEVLVEKGDHIRLQDFQLGYTWQRQDVQRLPFRSITLNGYANNLGILWKATDQLLDPDYPTMKPVRSFALGVTVQF